MSNNVKKIMSAIGAFFSILCIAITLTVVSNTGLVEGLNPEKFEERLYEEIRQKKKETVEGVFLDRNEYAITSANDPGKAATLLYPESFSAIIGYNSSRLYSKTSKTPGTSGLREKLYKYVFDGGKDNIGATVQLTVDAGLQESVYNLLDGSVGSISIINAETGEILAMASRGHATVGYNANLIDSVDSNGDYYSDKYNAIDEFYYNRAVLAQDPPGSTAKVMTATCLIENGKEDLVYTDTGKYLNNKIVNVNNSVQGECTLEDALNKSVNTYFAYAANEELGAAKLKETFARFMVGETVELDFCTLKSTFMKNTDYSSFLTASNGYGQGELVMTPLHIAMMMSSILNEGKMMTPYLIERITNDGKKVYSGDSELLSQATDKKTAKTVKELLYSNAKYYGLYEYFDKKDVYIIAKTGTAEVDRDDKNGNKINNHIYYAMGVEIDGTPYGICIDHYNTKEGSSTLKPVAVEVINALVSAVA